MISLPFLRKDKQIITAQLMAGLFPVYRDFEKLEKISSDNKEARERVRQSLDKFAERVNPARVSELVHRHKTKEGKIEEANFSIQPFAGTGTIYPSREINKKSTNTQTQFSDGDYGFFLGVKKNPDTRWLAMLSFYSREDAFTDYDENTNIFGDLPISVDALTVVQLQGVERKSSDGFETTLLRQFQWGHVMLTLFLQWAQAVRVSAVDLVPAEYNSWIDTTSQEKQLRFEKRYDKPAQNMGFRRVKNERGELTGLYTLPLSYPSFRVGKSGKINTNGASQTY